ncbi:hypothetical protein AB0436_11285 [Streptomyces sp. NPDC051322]|uniref:hypothetical protein n=1 Tax=Streptomyces sp. NPDC051322 TaxID=3154645 RepID=UPI00344BD5B6
MSDTRSQASAGHAGTGTVRNGPAKVSAFFALGGIASLGNFYTGIAWVNPGVFVGMAMLCALVAIVTGTSGASEAADCRRRKAGRVQRRPRRACCVAGAAVMER